MALTNIDNVPESTTPAPNRNTQEQSVFSANSDGSLLYQETLAENMNNSIGQMNTLGAEIEQIGVDVEANKDLAETAATNAENSATQAAADAGSANGNPLGDYANGLTFTSHNDYVSENGLFRLKDSVSTPYTTNTTTYPLATDDPNLDPWSNVDVLKSIALALNVPREAILNGVAGQLITAEKQYLYNPVDQTTWAIPTLNSYPATIDSVSGSDLVAGGVSYTLSYYSDAIVVFDNASDMKIGRTISAGGLSFVRGMVIETLSRFSGWAVTAPFYAVGGAKYIVTDDAPNEINIIDLGGGLSATLLYDKTVSLDQLGADRTGAIDIVPLLDVAKSLDAKITQHGGSFLIGSNFTMTSGLEIKFSGGAEFIRNADFRFIAGDSGDQTNLVATGEWGLGGRVITLDAASYAAVNEGDTLYIKNKVADNPNYILDFVATPNDLNDWVYQVQTPIVKSKNGANQITVSQAAKMPYDFDSTASVSRLDNLVRNVKIAAKFRNDIGIALPSSEAAFINASVMFGLNIAGSKFYMNAESPGVYISVGRIDSIRNTEFHDGLNLDLFLRQDCPNSKLIGGKFFNHRSNDASIFVEAHNYNIDIHGNSFDTAFWDTSTSIISAIHMDAKVNNCSINANQVYGYPVGVRMELGCFDNSVTGNTFQLCELSGVRMVSTRSNTITGNTFLDCGLSNTANGTLSQQQGGVYVNGIFDTQINNNTFTWVNPSFSGNFFAALSGSMNSSQFSGNTVNQSKRAVWIIGGGNNDISDNPKLEATGTANAVLINGVGSDYNKVNRNAIICDGSADATGVVIENGSEGNEVLDNDITEAAYATKVLSTSGYQSIARNRGDFARHINSDISAPVMPTNATAKRGFRIYNVLFDQIQAQGWKRWEYSQFIGGVGHRWNEFSDTLSTVDL